MPWFFGGGRFDCSKKLDEAEKAVNKIVNENGTMSDFNVEE